jgi:ABC-2 type transport system ATP-binding protein
MDIKTVIKVENVGKTFRLPHDKNNSVKSAVLNFYKSKQTYEKQRALEDITFSVNKGEFFGIVGRNGSGKSTMLKLLAGIYNPSRGNIEVNGKLTPFIELGVGFNPELTGRENIFLNGALLGFNRKEMKALYDDIVDFAELHNFMDQKLKNYSSGMQVRLAFSIAIRVETDILVLDEILAVGDEAFQQKCIDIFEKYKAEKRTIVLVTHDMGIVRQFCSRAMLINNGKLVDIGDPRDIARKYSELNNEKIDEELDKENIQTKSNKEANLKLNILREEGKNKNPSYSINDTLRVEVSWPKELKGVHNTGVAIMKQSGEYVFGANTFKESFDKKDNNSMVYEVKLSIGPGKYYLIAGLFGKKENEEIEFFNYGPKFIVKHDENDTSQGIAHLEYKWKA